MRFLAPANRAAMIEHRDQPLWRRSSAPDLRIGIGTDVHRLVPIGSFDADGRTGLARGGRGSRGPLRRRRGAARRLRRAALGGRPRRPRQQLRYVGTASGPARPGHDLLAETLRRVRADGWEVANVACQLIGNRPRFAARREEAERGVLERHGITVSLSATTTDGLGLTGRGEGLAAIATALLVPARSGGAD